MKLRAYKHNLTETHEQFKREQEQKNLSVRTRMELENSCRTLEEQLRNAESRVAAVMSESQGMKADLSLSIEGLRSQLEKSKGENNQAQIDYNVLKSQLTLIETQRDEAITRSKAVEQLQVQCKDLASQLSLAEQREKAFKEDLKGQLEKATGENNQARTDLALLRSKLALAEKERNAAIASREEIESLEKQSGNLASQVASAEATKKAVEKDRDEKQEELARISDEKEKLDKVLSSERELTASLNFTIKTLQSEVGTLRETCTTQATTISKLQFDVQALDIDLAKVREEAQNAQRALAEAQGDIASKEKARRELQDSCTELRDGIEATERLKNQAVEIQRKLEEEKNQLKEELRGSNHSYGTLKAEKELIEMKLARLEKEKAEHLGNADERYAHLDSRYTELQGRLNQASEERRGLEAELQRTNGRLESVSEQKKALEVKKDLLEKEKQVLEKLNAQLNSEVGSLKAKQEERNRPVKQEPVADNGRNSENLLRDELAKEREARQKAEKELQKAEKEREEALREAQEAKAGKKKGEGSRVISKPEEVSHTDSNSAVPGRSIPPSIANPMVNGRVSPRPEGGEKGEGSRVISKHEEVSRTDSNSAVPGRSIPPSIASPIVNGRVSPAPEGWERSKAERLFLRATGTDIDREVRAMAYADLGLIYREGGHGVLQNYAKAIEFFKLAAEQTDSELAQVKAWFNLAEMYALNEGNTERWSEAKELFEKVSMQTQAKYKEIKELALWYLGEIYNAEKDYAKAKHFFELLMESGTNERLLAVVCYALGDMYYLGYGIGQNYPKAKELFERAADQNDNKWIQAGAWVRLADMHYLGLGISIDVAEAKRLIKLATEQTVNDEAQQEALDYSQLIATAV